MRLLLRGQTHRPTGSNNGRGSGSTTERQSWPAASSLRRLECWPSFGIRSWDRCCIGVPDARSVAFGGSRCSASLASGSWRARSPCLTRYRCATHSWLRQTCTSTFAPMNLRNSRSSTCRKRFEATSTLDLEGRNEIAPEVTVGRVGCVNPAFASGRAVGCRGEGDTHRRWGFMVRWHRCAQPLQQKSTYESQPRAYHPPRPSRGRNDRA